MKKKLFLPGGILWVIGLVMSIVGMNLEGNAGTWVATIGNILFLVGLGIVGAAWMIARKNEEKQGE